MTEEQVKFRQQYEGTFKQVIDGTKPGYESDIVTDPDSFLRQNPLPEPQEVLNSVVSGLPGKNKSQQTPILLVNGIRVRYRKVPAMLYNTAKGMLAQKMKRNKPLPQEFIADTEGNRVLGDQNPAYHEALRIWELEWDDIDTLVSTGVSLFSGLILVDGMPEDSEWIPDLRLMFESAGLEFDTASFIYEPEKIKELYYKQYVVLSNASDMANFTNYQSNGDSDFTGEQADIDAAVSMF